MNHAREVPPEQTRVNLSEIVLLVIHANGPDPDGNDGVSRPMVKGWRSSHPDFPLPVGGTEDSPEFDRAEVERWLAHHGKIPLLTQIFVLATDTGAGTPAQTRSAPEPAVVIDERLIRAAVSGEFPVLGMIRALADGALKRVGLDQAVKDAGRAGKSVLSVQRQWALDAGIDMVRPLVLAAGLQAIAGLSASHRNDDGILDVEGLRGWLTVQAQTVRSGEAGMGVVDGPDSAVIAMCLELARELDGLRPPGDPAAQVVTRWGSRPGADLSELLLAACWFAAVMLAHAMALEPERLYSYLDQRMVQLHRAGAVLFGPSG